MQHALIKQKSKDKIFAKNDNNSFENAKKSQPY